MLCKVLVYFLLDVSEQHRSHFLIAESISEPLPLGYLECHLGSQLLVIVSPCSPYLYFDYCITRPEAVGFPA